MYTKSSEKTLKLIRWLLLLRAAILCGLIFSIITVGATAKRKRSLPSLIKERRQLSQKIKQVRTAIKKTKQKERQLSSIIKKTQQKLEYTQQQLSDTESRLLVARWRLQATKKALEKAQRRLSRHQVALSRRLRAIHENNNELGYLQVVAQTKSLEEFICESYYLQLLINYDAKLLKKVKEAKEQVEQQKQRIERQTSQLSALKAQQQQQQRAYGLEYSRKAQLLHQIRTQRQAYERALIELEQTSREIEAMLRRLLETPEGKRSLARPWRGNFIKPVAGPIVSGFGLRTHPIFKITKMHTGIDISAPKGTQILAAAAGKVIFSGWWGGYGYTVIIDHGGGIATLYAHCNSILVYEKQRVRQGQVIATVGDTGLSTGSHLHFEVRNKGEPVNPLKF